MQSVLIFATGAAVGAVCVRLLMERSSCCRRVSEAVRDRATDAAGSWLGPVGDALGLWDVAPGLLDTLGVS